MIIIIIMTTMTMIMMIHKFTGYSLLLENFNNITKSNISFNVYSVYSVQLVAELFSSLPLFFLIFNHLSRSLSNFYSDTFPLHN